MSDTDATAETVRALIRGFAADELTDDELVTRLASLSFPPAPRTLGEHDDLLPSHPLDALIDAHRAGLVDDHLYDQVADAIEREADTSRHPRRERQGRVPADPERRYHQGT